MRVIAGKYRSRPLRSLRGMDIRPTSDRLRETLFNVLTAGNPGSARRQRVARFVRRDRGGRDRGFEPRSKGSIFRGEFRRGGGSDPQAICKASGIANGFKILQDELPRAFWRMERQHVAADVVFIDPPYRMKDAYTNTLRALGGFVASLGDVGGDCRT